MIKRIIVAAALLLGLIVLRPAAADDVCVGAGGSGPFPVGAPAVCVPVP